MNGRLKGTITIMVIAAVLAGGLFYLTGADQVKVGPVEIGNNPESDYENNSGVITSENSGVVVEENSGNVSIIIGSSPTKKESSIDLNLVDATGDNLLFTISNSQGGIALVNEITLIVDNIYEINDCKELSRDISTMPYQLGFVKINSNQKYYPLLDQTDKEYLNTSLAPTSFYYGEGDLDTFSMGYFLSPSNYDLKSSHSFDVIVDVEWCDTTNCDEKHSEQTIKKTVNRLIERFQC